MSQITLPAGLSLRAIADRLGVPIGELKKHAAIDDVEAPLRVDRRIDVPDGFLRIRQPRFQKKEEAVPTPTARAGGMNTWMAMDIEQKRMRIAGGRHAHNAQDDEISGLAEARRAYFRFEAQSNDLAIALYHQLVGTHSVDVRAQAFAGQGLAHAQRHRLFGEPAERVRPQALSEAKAAILADPQLAEAHLAMGLALDIGVEHQDLKDAEAEFTRAAELDEHNGWIWAALAAVQRRLQSKAAGESAARALVETPGCPFALETLAHLAWDRGQRDDAAQLMTQATILIPTYANAFAGLALARARLHQTVEAGTIERQALSLATTVTHCEYLRIVIAGNNLPYA